MNKRRDQLKINERKLEHKDFLNAEAMRGTIQ